MIAEMIHYEFVRVDRDGPVPVAILKRCDTGEEQRWNAESLHTRLRNLRQQGADCYAASAGLTMLEGLPKGGHTPGIDVAR